MFPFLGPLKHPEHEEQQGTETLRVVRIKFLLDSPHASRAGSAASTVAPRIVNKEFESRSKSSEVISRSSSRQAAKSPLIPSQPTSARSMKSSPIPPPSFDAKPVTGQRHKNKGLEMSDAMKNLFGGEPSPREEPEKKKSVEDRFTKANVPGPEWYEGYEKLDMTGIDLPPDPECPAQKVLESQETRKTSYSGWFEMESPKATTSRKKSMVESQPGPDLGDDYKDSSDEEEPPVSDELVQAASIKRSSDEEKPPRQPDTPATDGERDQREGRDADGQSNSGDALPATGNGQGEEEVAPKGGKSAGGMSLLIKGAQIVNDDSIFVSDVLIVDGLIANVAPKIEAEKGVEVIDASGKMLLPAGIDVHTHFSAEESVDDFATGCRAALAGGTATVVEVAIPKPGEGVLAAFTRVKQAAEKALCNVAITVAVKDWNDAIRKDMEKLVAQGVNSFVVEVDGDEKVYQILEHSRSLGAHARILPENKSIISLLEKKMLGLGITGPEGFVQSRPENVEAERVSSACLVSQLTNCPISIVSVSSTETVTALEKARGSGTLAHAEVASAAVAADAQGYFDKDLKNAATHVTNVPLRNDATSRLLNALSSQPLAVCTSAHKAVPTSAKTKAKDFVVMPKGSTGAEERLSLLWEKAVRTGKMDPMRFVAVTSSNAAKIFNCYPKKGRIAVGADADLVIWDQNGKKKLTSSDAQSAVDNSIYDGISVHATASATIVGGNVVYKDGTITDTKAPFLALSPNSPYLFSCVGQRDKFDGIQKIERDQPVQQTNGNSQSRQVHSADRDRNRKNLMESSIDFGGPSKNRNPPGGRSTGFW